MRRWQGPVFGAWQREQQIWELNERGRRQVREKVEGESSTHQAPRGARLHRTQKKVTEMKAITAYHSASDSSELRGMAAFFQQRAALSTAEDIIGAPAHPHCRALALAIPAAHASLSGMLAASGCPSFTCRAHSFMSPHPP